MAAPRRKSAPVRPKPQPAASAAPLSGGVMEGGASEPAPIKMVLPNQNVSKDDLFLMKLSQVIMLGIGFLSIWIGIFGIAYDEDATNENFLVIFVGGLASFAVTIALIEVQSKKNDYRLQDIQNYFLGVAFFFSTVGMLWGARFLMGYATGTLELDLFGNPALYDDSDWSPNANGIYAQTLAVVILTAGHYFLLQRYSGDTSFGWGVATYAPMAVLLAGVGPWVSWSGNEVSWELGIAIVLISIISMEMALRSNRAMNFVIIAVAAGIVPIIYELLNTGEEVISANGQGGALSLMVFIIGLQGYYASRTDLKKEVMERASAVLIGMVVIAIALARSEPDLNLILGGFRAADHPELAAYVNIPVALWVTVLLAYFPAVLQQRVPWMPIGLAVALAAIPPEASTVPWVLSMIVIPYMVFISKIARAWVVNITLIAFSASYLFTDWIGSSEGLSAQATYGGGWLHVLVPIFIVAISELGRRMERFETSTSLFMLGSVILSRAVLDPEWFLPWLLVAYMCFMNYSMMVQYPDPTLKQRKNLTFALIFTSVTIFLLAILDNLKLPPGDTFAKIVDDGIRPQFFVLSLAMYALAAKASKRELDIGSIFAWLGQGNESDMVYNQTTNAWEYEKPDQGAREAQIEKAALTPLARVSLLTSLVLFTFTITDTSLDVWQKYPALVLIMLFPVLMLIREVVAQDTISSATRATAVTLLFLIAAPLSLSFGPEVWNIGDKLNTTTMLLDAILVSAPLIVNFVISRRGLDVGEANRSADAVAYIMLLFLGMLDTSGGLLLIPMLVLVTWRLLQYHFYWLLATVPLVFVILGDGWLEHGLMQAIFDTMPSGMADYMMDPHNGTFPAFVGLIVTVQMILGLSGIFANKMEEAESTLFIFFMVIWLLLGLISAIPDAYWLPSLACFVLIPYFWYNNNSQIFPYMLGALFLSLFIGFEESNTFQPMTDADAWGWSGIITGIVGSTMGIMHNYGTLFRTPPSGDEGQQLADSTASLTTQLGALGFVAGYSVLFGIGPVIGLVMLVQSALKYGQANSLIAFPILLTFSIVNMMVQIDIGTDAQRDVITGGILAAQGIMLTFLSAKDDLVYDYEHVKWSSDDAFFAFMDRLGVSGMLYSIVGVFIALNSANLESLAYLLVTVYLIVIGIQGFSDEADARWRRGLGGYGAIVTAFMFANSIDSNIFQAIATVMAGMVALGFGFLFMQRLNENDGIYDQDIAPAQSPSAGPSQEAVPEPAQEIEEVVEAAEEESAEAIDIDETPAEEIEADKEESAEDTAAEAEEDDEEMAEELEELLEALGDVENEEVPESSEPVEEKPVEEPVAKPEVVEAHSGLLDTGEGFALRLPKDAVDNIISSLENTPHEGYTPVVAFGPNGQIMLTFESAKDQA